MASFLGEIKRRKVFQVAAVYAVVAWLLVQVVSTVEEPLQLPEWFDTAVIVLLAIGFPIALILSWAFEITPDGIKSAEVVKTADGAASGSLRIGYTMQALVLLAVSFLIFDQYMLNSATNGGGSARSTALSPELRRVSINLGRTEPIGNTRLSAHIALSSDGQRLVYSAKRQGVTSLYLRNLDQFEARELPGTEGAYSPYFSPNGEWVVFYSDETDQKLKKVSVLGGEPQILADTNYSGGAAWGRDDTIVFSTGDNASGRSLFSIPANGGEPRVVIPSGTDEGYVRPAVLPDSSALLVVIRPGAGGNGDVRDGYVAVFSPETGELRPLIQRGYSPRYASTGHILFVRTGDLWAVPFDSQRLEVTGQEVPIIEGVETDSRRGGSAYAFSDNGLLAYVAGVDTAIEGVGDDTTLVWVDRQGNEQQVATQRRDSWNPRIAPGGDRLLFTSSVEGNSDVWIYDIARQTERRLTTHPSAVRAPMWTPDGAAVVFNSNRDQGGLFLKSVDGTEEESLLFENGYALPFSYSPDASKLFYGELLGSSQSGDLHVLSLEGQPLAAPILETPFNENRPTISPDGSWLAYESDESGQTEIYLQRFPVTSTDRWRVSRDGGVQPRWNPNGSEIFYRGREGLMSVSVRTVTEPSLDEPSLLFADVYTPSPYDTDGERFLMVKNINSLEQRPAQTELRLIENWFEELERLAPPSE